MNHNGPLLILALATFAACKFPYPPDLSSDGRTSDAGDTDTQTGDSGQPVAPTIAFTSDRSGNDDIYVAHLGDSMPANLTNTPAADTTPLWSPSGSHLAFLSNRSGKIELYVVRADGTGIVNISKGLAYSFDWSPDGTRLVFDSNRTGSNELFRGTIDGAMPTQLTTLGGSNPRWSPDGLRLVFANAGGLFVANADGVGANRVSMGTDSSPAWNPASTKVSFSRRITFVNNDVFVVGADGANTLNVTHSTDTTAYRPSWSPDGTRIAVLGGTDVNSDIYVVGGNGDGLTNVSMTAGYDADQRWSPDGAVISFTTAGEILLVPSVGGPSTNLTMDPSVDRQAAWRPSP